MFFDLWQYWYKAIQLKHVVNAYSPHYVPIVSVKMRIWYSLWSNYTWTERLQIGVTLLVPLWMISRRYFVVCLGEICSKIPMQWVEIGEALLVLIRQIATQLRLLLSASISMLYKLVQHILAAVSYVCTTSFLAFYEGMQCKVIENALQNDSKRSVKHRIMHCKVSWNAVQSII